MAARSGYGMSEQRLCTRYRCLYKHVSFPLKVTFLEGGNDLGAWPVLLDVPSTNRFLLLGKLLESS